MNDILLVCIILFSGFVPVAIALFYSKQLLKKADLLYNMGKAERETTVADMKKWLLEDEFSLHLKNVFNGLMGSTVKKVKGTMQDELLQQGIPPPAKKAIAKGARGLMEDYGMSPKTAKGVEAGLMALFNRPSKEKIAQQDQMIRQMMGPIDPNMVGPVQQEQFL